MGFNVAADINAKLNQQSMSSALSSLKSQFQGLGVDLKVNIPDLSKNAGGFKLVADSVDRTSASIEKFGEQAGIATKRLLAYTAATTALLGPLAILRSAVDEAIKFQREIVRVSQVAGDTKTELKGLQDQITNLAKTLGVSSLELIKSATVFRQAGFNAKETADSIGVLAKALLAPNFDNGTQIAETIVALKSQFKEATRDGESLANTIGGINAVAGAFAVEAKDLEETIKRAGGSFAAAGGKVEELSALFTSVRATTRESAESIATAFRTIFARLQRADIIDQLRSFGIELRRTREEAIGLGNAKLEGQFVGAYEAIRRLSAAVKDLPSTDQRFAAIAEEIGGYRQLSKVIPLLQQFEKAQEALNVAQSGAASLNVNAAQSQDAYTTKITKVKEEIASLGRTIVDSPGFAKLFEFFTTTASAAVKLAEAIAPIIPLLTALATVKLAAGLSSLGSGFIGGFGSKIDSAGRSIRRNSGGPIPGVGSTDTVPAMLTPGEFVIRKEAAQRIGLSTLNAMNSSKPHGYAHGGIVGGVQFFAGGGNVERAIESVDSGKSIGLAAKNANVSVAELTKKLGEQGKLTVENTAGLGKVAKAIAESFLNKTSSTSLAATGALPTDPKNSRGQVNLGELLDKAEAKAKAEEATKKTFFNESLAGKKTTQKDLFREELLPEIGGLAPAAVSSRRKSTTIAGDLEAQRAALGLTLGNDQNLLPATPSNRKALEFDSSKTVATPLPALSAAEASKRNSEFLKQTTKNLNIIPDDLKLIGDRKPFQKLPLPVAQEESSRTLSPATISQFGFDKATGTGSILSRIEKINSVGSFLGAGVDKASGFFGGVGGKVVNAVPNLLSSIGSGIGGNSLRENASILGNKALSGTTSLVAGAGRNIASPLGLGALFFGAEALRKGGNNEITAQQAAQGPLSGKFQQQEGIKEAVSGAQIGAGVGAIAGPFGIAIGALTGALVGYTDGIREAEKKISQVKLDESLGKLKTEVEDVVGNKAGNGVGNINALLSNARRESFTNTSKGLEASSFDKGLFKVTGGIFGTEGPSIEDRVRAKNDNFRNQIGLQLPQLNQIAGRQATEGAKNLVSSTGSLDGGLIRAESQKFADGFSVANAELIKNIALIKGVSIDKVVKEFQKQFEDQAKALSLAKNSSNAKSGTNNVLESVDRLAKAFDAAAEAATETARANGLLQDVFTGSVSTVQSRNLGTGVANLGVVGAASQESFNRTSGVVNSVLGGGGGSFGEAIAGLNSLEQSLPNIIVNALKTNPGGGDALVVKVREQLNQTGATEQQKNSIISRLEPLTGDISKFAERVKESSEKLAKELTADSVPLVAAFAKIAQDINTQSNAFIAGLSQAGRNVRQIASADDRVNTLGTNRLRTGAQFRAADALRSNRFSNASGTDFFSEEEAERPFQIKQQRLLGQQGLDPRNANDFKKVFDSGQIELERLGKARDAAQGTAGEKDAAKAFQEQQNKQADLLEGIKNLSEDTTRSADATQRLSTINDKLARIDASKQAGIGLNERVFRAQAGFDFKELRNIQQGAQGAEFLRRGGNIRQLSPEQGLATDSFLQSSGALSGNRLKRGADGKVVVEKGVTNEQLRQEQFVNGPFDGGAAGGQNARDKATQDAAAKKQQDRILDEQKVQTEGAIAYKTILDATNRDFVTKLDAAFDKFRNTVQEQKVALESNILQSRKRSLEAEQAGFKGTSGEAKKALGEAGIKTQAQLDAIKANSGDLAEIGALTKRRAEINAPGARFSAEQAAADSLNRGGNVTGLKVNGKVVGVNEESEERLSDAFKRAGVDNDRIPVLVRQFSRRFADNGGNSNADGVKGGLLKSVLNNEFDRQTNDIDIELGKKQGRASNNLNRAGVDAGKLINNPKVIEDILANSAKLGTSLDGVDTRLAEFDKNIKAASDSLAALSGVPQVAAVKKAFGGSIFASRGTDTVPAMLTPGEFVVNANAARQNIGLLQRINNSGNSGPVYAATGGSISANGTSGVSLDVNATAMKAAFDSFVIGSQALVSALNNFPKEIQGTFNHKIEVIHNGVEMFANLQPSIVSLIEQRVEKSMEVRDNKLRSQGFNI